MSAPIVLKLMLTEQPGPLGQAGAAVGAQSLTPGYDVHASVDHVEHAEDTIAASLSVSVTPRRRSKGQGLASLSVGRRRAIASEGGKTAHKKGAAHHFTNDEARTAGRRGGAAVSADAAHMAEIGAKGGKARSERLRVDMGKPSDFAVSNGAPEDKEI